MMKILSALIAGAAAAAPIEQVHIALAAENEMRISFKAHTSEPLTCVYNNLTSAPSTVRSYFPGGGYYHHVLLQDLTPSAVYTYSCAGSAAFSFTAPPAASVFAPFSMAVFGDWGYLGSKERGPSLPVGGLSSNWSAVPVRELLEDLKDAGKISMILHAGDLVYADDAFGEHPLQFQYENVTDGWFNWIQNLSASLPYHVSVGNRAWRPRRAARAPPSYSPPPL